jgi:hypothetical protein
VQIMWEFYFFYHFIFEKLLLNFGCNNSFRISISAFNKP